MSRAVDERPDLEGLRITLQEPIEVREGIRRFERKQKGRMPDAVETVVTR